VALPARLERTYSEEPPNWAGLLQEKRMMKDRRSTLGILAASPLMLAPGLAQAAGTGRLPAQTIESLEVVRVKVNRRGNWIIPRLKTNGGLTGLGDASQSFSEPQCLAFLKQYGEMLRGRSIYDVGWFRGATAPIRAQNGGHFGRTPAAMAASALEQAMWDIQGKALGLPCYDLFGGRIQQRIRVYANINRSTDDRTPAGFAANAQRAVDAGFDAIKLAPFDDMPRNLSGQAEIDHYKQIGIDCARAVRDVIGPGRDLLVDAHSHFDLANGLNLAHGVEPLGLYWLEEVCPPQPVTNLAEINRAAKMKTAGGEGIHGVTGFYPYIKADAVDIVMPDVKVTGGMLELKKIAALAEGAGKMTSPHGPASPIGNAAAAHVMATVPNFEIFEFSFGEVPWRSELVDPPEQVIKSSLVLSDRPGLGYAINQNVADKYAEMP
jgi:galactonate dehydratase